MHAMTKSYRFSPGGQIDSIRNADGSKDAAGYPAFCRYAGPVPMTRQKAAAALREARRRGLKPYRVRYGS